VSSFRNFDADNCGYVTVHDFRRTIYLHLGTTMSQVCYYHITLPPTATLTTASLFTGRFAVPVDRLRRTRCDFNSIYLTPFEPHFTRCVAISHRFNAI